MSERMPDILGSVGWILRVEHPISGARFSMDSMHSALEKMESRLRVDEMRSKVNLTILLSTFAARPMAASVSSISPQYAFPSMTLMPWESRRRATFICEGYPSNIESVMFIALDYFMHYLAFLCIEHGFSGISCKQAACSQFKESSLFLER